MISGWKTINNFSRLFVFVHFFCFYRVVFIIIVIVTNYWGFAVVLFYFPPLLLDKLFTRCPFFIDNFAKVCICAFFFAIVFLIDRYVLPSVLIPSSWLVLLFRPLFSFFFFVKLASNIIGRYISLTTFIFSTAHWLCPRLRCSRFYSLYSGLNISYRYFSDLYR